MRERVRDLSEFALIGRLRDALPVAARSSDAVAVGIGDDAAVWRPVANESVLVTSDSLIDTIHFRTDWTSWEDLGWKSLAVNISDIAAMGGAPALATVSLALTGNELAPDLEALYRGMGAIAMREGTVLAGGDIVRTPHDFGIHVTVLGRPATESHCSGAARSGRPDCRHRDTRCGGDRVGIAAIAGERSTTEGIDRSNADRGARPAAATGAGRASRAGIWRDGRHGSERWIVRGSAKILVASGVDAMVDLDAIPVAAAVRALFPERWLDLATRGGEDYELLLTIPAERVGLLQDALTIIGQTLTVIGSVGSYSATPALSARSLTGGLVPVTSGAFDHFRS